MSEKQIELLNKIVAEAINHGGDPGGAYFCNEDGLRAALQKYIDENDLSEQYRISSGSSMMRIVGAKEIFPCKTYEGTGECFYGEDDRGKHNKETRYMSCDDCDWKKFEQM